MNSHKPYETFSISIFIILSLSSLSTNQRTALITIPTIGVTEFALTIGSTRLAEVPYWKALASIECFRCWARCCYFQASKSDPETSGEHQPRQTLSREKEPRVLLLRFANQSHKIHLRFGRQFHHLQERMSMKPSYYNNNRDDDQSTVQSVFTYMPYQARVVSDWYKKNVDQENKRSVSTVVIEPDPEAVEIKGQCCPTKKSRSLISFCLVLFVATMLITMINSLLLTQKDKHNGGVVPGILDLQDIFSACDVLEGRGEIKDDLSFVVCKDQQRGGICRPGIRATLYYGGYTCVCGPGESSFVQGIHGRGACSDVRLAECEPFPFPV